MRCSAGLLALAMVLAVGLCALGTTAAEEELPEGLTDDLFEAMHVPPDDIRADLEARGAVVNERDGSILVPIPEEEAIFGSPDHVGQASEHPQFRATLPAYYIAAHEVTNAQWKRFVDATDHDTSRLDNMWYGDPAMQDHPVVHVSWGDAQAYADWAALRLPTELEWEKGARGNDGRAYPWGEEWDDTRCTDGPETPTSVYTNSSGRSPYGLFDLAGNVWEWCADWYDPRAYQRYAAGDLTPPVTGDGRTLRGASWGRDDESFFRGAARGGTDPGNSSPFGGVRLARAFGR